MCKTDVEVHEKAMAEVYAARRRLIAAHKALSKAKPLGITVRTTSPRNRLLITVEEAIATLTGIEDEYRAMLDAAFIEAAHFANSAVE